MGALMGTLCKEDACAARALLHRVTFDAHKLVEPQTRSEPEVDSSTCAALRGAVEVHGFAILKGLLDPAEIANWRRLAIKHLCEEKPMLEVGYFLSDLSRREPFAAPLMEILKRADVAAAFGELTGKEGFRFCQHSDIAADRIVFWHKDKLNGKYAEYQKLSPWEVGPDGSQHRIYKLLLYLEDHSDDERALRLIPGSHLEPQIVLADRRYLQLRPGLGDAVLIDQRITHTGQSQLNPPPPRILLSIGFGANNIFTDEFEQGTVARQRADSVQMQNSANLPLWRRVLSRLIQEWLLWPALSLVYTYVNPVIMEKVAKHVYG